MTTRRFRRRLAVVILLALGMTAAVGAAAIFATDVVHLHDGAAPVTDNSVVVLRRWEGGRQSWELCENGRLFLRQGPGWAPGPHVFIRTRHPDIATFDHWRRGPEGAAAADQHRGYQLYLRAKAAEAAGRVEVTLPSVGESPALDSRPPPPPRPGMAEGRLGFDRHFAVDLASGTVTQVAAPPR